MKCSRFFAALLTLSLTGALLAGNLPRLPGDRALPQGTDSPGVVTFRHATHVDAGKPDCTICHPALFPILHRSAAQAAPKLTHKGMEKGEACGTCHDGKSAHGFEDCTTCHATPKER
jgi:c(7)-type cytochrome triheme protein